MKYQNDYSATRVVIYDKVFSTTLGILHAQQTYRGTGYGFTWCKKVLLTLMKEARVFLYNPKKPFLICTMSTSQRVTTTRTRVVSSVPRPCACLVCVKLHWHMFVHVFTCVCQCVYGMNVGMCGWVDGWVFEILKNEVKVPSRSHIYTFMDLYSRWAK